MQKFKFHTVPSEKYQFATSDPVKALQITDKKIEEDIFHGKQQKIQRRHIICQIES